MRLPILLAVAVAIATLLPLYADAGFFSSKWRSLIQSAKDLLPGASSQSLRYERLGPFITANRETLPTSGGTERYEAAFSRLTTQALHSVGQRAAPEYAVSLEREKDMLLACRDFESKDSVTLLEPLRMWMQWSTAERCPFLALALQGIDTVKPRALSQSPERIGEELDNRLDGAKVVLELEAALSKALRVMLYDRRLHGADNVLRVGRPGPSGTSRRWGDIKGLSDVELRHLNLIVTERRRRLVRGWLEYSRKLDELSADPDFAWFVERYELEAFDDVELRALRSQMLEPVAGTPRYWR